MITDYKKIDSDDGRYYEIEVGGGIKKLISVTSVLGAILAKPALVPWAFNLGIENTLLLLRERAESAIEEGRAEEFALACSVQSEAPVKQTLKERELTTKGHAEKASSRGTEVHTILETKIKNEDPDTSHQVDTVYSSEVNSYVVQLEKFIDEYGVEFVDSELTVFSVDKEYAGTLDAIAYITKHPKRRRHESLVGKKMVIDLKTNKNASVYKNIHFPQLTAYRNALTEAGIETNGSMVVAAGPERYGIGVNNYPDNAFDLIHEVWKMYESVKVKK